VALTKLIFATWPSKPKNSNLIIFNEMRVQPSLLKLSFMFKLIQPSIITFLDSMSSICSLVVYKIPSHHQKMLKLTFKWHSHYVPGDLVGWKGHLGECDLWGWWDWWDWWDLGAAFQGLLSIFGCYVLKVSFTRALSFHHSFECVQYEKHSL
jgi:hypothetical protein